MASKPKLPPGPMGVHKSLAVGETLKEATSEAKIGGSKTDRSNKTNK